jgi:hypothetical protein
MVTNERQRMYAVETRRNIAAARKEQKQKSQGSETPTPPADATQPDVQQEAPSTPSAWEIDPKLNQYHYSIGSSALQSQQPDVATPARIGMRSVFARKVAEVRVEGLKYHVSIMQEGRRLMPRFTLTPNTCPTFSSLIQHINSVLDDDGLKVGVTKVMGPGGLLEVNDESSWAEAVEIVKQTEWLDEEVRCIVDVD